MNEMNFPETRLRSWQPRPPSSTLRRRIFEAPAVPAQPLAWSFRWLAPAVACLFVAIAVLDHENPLSQRPARSDFMLGMIGSNQLACIPSRYLQSENGFAPLTFEWTNRSGSTSSIGPFSPVKMN